MHTPRSPRSIFTCATVLALLASTGTAHAQYARRDLVSNVPGQAAFTDPNLVNGWGVAFNPTGVVWVSAAGTGTSTLYNGLGQVNPLVVDIPAPGGGLGTPTGIVFSGGADFIVTDGAVSAPARFIFATEQGMISGWAPAVPPPPPSRDAMPAVDRSDVNANYKGLALASTPGGNRLLAADFANGRIDTFDGGFNLLGQSFNDPTLPGGYSPFNVSAMGGRVYVTYALQDAGGEEEVIGAGNGIVSVFGTDGSFQQRLVDTGDVLNAPWGMAIAPAGFGPLSGALLVGNFGDGRINAFDPVTGAPLGVLPGDDGNPLEVDGLWGFAFGNGVQFQPRTTLFFAAGPDGETNGLYGRIDVPAPGCAAVLMSVAAHGLGRRRRAR